jgi:pilus assembly protein TadC
MSNSIFKIIASNMPNLKHQLRQADMLYEPEVFVKNSFVSALIMSFGISIFFIGGILKSFDAPIYYSFIIFPFLFLFFFVYLFKVPLVKIKKKKDEIDREIVFATRFLIIEIESGVPLYDCFINISKAYPYIGKTFKGVVESVNLGTSMDDAINEIVELTPSDNLRKVLWQILNTINTGADVTKPLNSVLEQIIKEQQIEIQEYGRKLNPMAMFYMMVAVILPSLGTTMIIIFSSFIGFKLGLAVMLTIAGLIGFMQFMFYAFIKSSRPAVEV